MAVTSIDVRAIQATWDPNIFGGDQSKNRPRCPKCMSPLAIPMRNGHCGYVGIAQTFGGRDGAHECLCIESIHVEYHAMAAAEACGAFIHDPEFDVCKTCRSPFDVHVHSAAVIIIDNGDDSAELDRMVANAKRRAGRF